jgi:hypothetical protein
MCKGGRAIFNRFRVLPCILVLLANTHLSSPCQSQSHQAQDLKQRDTHGITAVCQG